MASKFLVDEILKDAQYKKREEPWLHIPYEQELVLLNLVKAGDTEGIRDAFVHFDPRDHLSSSKLRQRKYELIATATLLTRWAVEGGLDVETAYDLADAYINTADKTDDVNTVIALIKEAPLHFATMVAGNKRKHRLPKPVLQCIEYIESNLHSAISVRQLAAHTGKNASYLSTLFKRETGLSISDYIMEKKLEEARQMLAGTDAPIAGIANTLSFGSQSYFSYVFKQHFGETPRAYRQRNFRAHR